MPNDSGSARKDSCALTFEDLRFEVSASEGGRITSFSLGDANVLAGPDVDPSNYGSTLWTSPQSDWGWPPPLQFDALPFALEQSADVLSLVGPPCPALGIRLLKRFRIDRPRKAIALRYTIENVASESRRCAAWEVSRVSARGLTFFPTGSCHGGPLPVLHACGATWYAHDPASLDDVGQKHVADGKLGYVAHVAGRLLYIKMFRDLCVEEQAPGEGEVEVYGNNRYVEVEAQGPVTSIAPGESASWEVRWVLQSLPAALEVHAGSQELLAFATRIANERRATGGGH